MRVPTLDDHECTPVSRQLTLLPSSRQASSRLSHWVLSTTRADVISSTTGVTERPESTALFAGGILFWPVLMSAASDVAANSSSEIWRISNSAKLLTSCSRRPAVSISARKLSHSSLKRASCVSRSCVSASIASMASSNPEAVASASIFASESSLHCSSSSFTRALSKSTDSDTSFACSFAES